MRESLLRLRWPLAVLLLGVSAFQVVLRLVWVALDAAEDGFVTAAARNYDALGRWPLALVIALAVAACRLLPPVVQAARALAVFAAVLVGVQVVLGTLFALIALVLDEARGAFTVFRLLFSFADLAVMVGILVALCRLVGAPAGHDHTPVPESGGSLVGSDAGTGAGPQVVGHPGWGHPDQQVQPDQQWQPDQQSGAVWGSAQHAAGGGAATGWGGAPHQGTGWTPAPLPPPSAEPRPGHPWPPSDEAHHTRIFDPPSQP